PPLNSTLFPYTTLFRSHEKNSDHEDAQISERRNCYLRPERTRTGTSSGELAQRSNHPLIASIMAFKPDVLPFVDHYRTLPGIQRSEEHTSELQSRENLV